MSPSQRNIKTFEDLKVWKKAREIRKEISNLVDRFPNEERYRLKDQLLRASRSIPANIAEGYGRFHYQENIQFCRQARGSAYEVIDHLICAKDEGFIGQEKVNVLRKKITVCVKMLNGYIRYLKKAKADKMVKETEISYRADP
jgi:four helix bundle protein